MTQDQIFNFFNIHDMIDLPNAAWALLSLPKIDRDKRYKELIKINHYDMSQEWFKEAYEEELAQRKKSKQDFTPYEVSVVASRLTGNKEGSIHEPTAGTGSMIIADWWERCRNKIPWDYYPSRNMVDCWELSDRAIPLLLINLSIRGIMGYVNHGDVLEQTRKARYVLLNRTDDALAFSEVIEDKDMNMRIIQEI